MGIGECSSPVMGSLRSVVCHATFRLDMRMIRIRRQGRPRIENQKSEDFQISSCAQETCWPIGNVLLFSKATIFVEMRDFEGSLINVNRRLRTGVENL